MYGCNVGMGAMEVNLNFVRDGVEIGCVCVRKTELTETLSQFATYDIFMSGLLLSPKNERTSLLTPATQSASTALPTFPSR